MKKLVFTDIAVVVLVLFCTSLLFLSCDDSVRVRAIEVKCKANLDQMGKGMSLYVQDFGRGVRYPQTNGGGFLAALYKESIIQETVVYRCPGTQDTVTSETLQAIKGKDSEVNGISYAGRKNVDQKIYPGIFKPTMDTHLTPIASDDWQGTPNHENGSYINFLFLDGHVDHVRKKEVSGDNYNAYLPLADPLTN